MTSPRRLAATTSQKEPARVYADADPTGATIEFGVTTGPLSSTQPSSWVAGDWDTWTASTGSATALTPRIGSATATPAAQIAVTAGTWRLWVRVTTASERPVIDLGLLEAY